jgi:hypothetical protein
MEHPLEEPEDRLPILEDKPFLRSRSGGTVPLDYFYFAIQSKSMQSLPAKLNLSESFRYWEPRRLPYNALLTLVALGWIALTWPHFRPSLNLRAGAALGLLALVANVCYSVVYLADIPALHSPLRSHWIRWRGLVLALGMLLGVMLEMYWIADEIYPNP